MKPKGYNERYLPVELIDMLAIDHCDHSSDHSFPARNRSRRLVHSFRLAFEDLHPSWSRRPVQIRCRYPFCTGTLTLNSAHDNQILNTAGDVSSQSMSDKLFHFFFTINNMHYNNYNDVVRS